MKRIILCLLCALLCAGCSATAPSAEDDTVLVAAATYPVYELADALIGDTDGVRVTLLIDQSVSCVHDYTLTVDQMRTLEKADIVLLSGAGLEDFMSDALRTTDAAIIDCSAGIPLLPYADDGHDSHDDAHEHGDENHDPHIWMDPVRYAKMADNAAAGLAAALPDCDTQTLNERAATLTESLTQLSQTWRERFDALPEKQKQLITFHNGFSYFADAFGLTLLKAIEEEAGSEASAADIAEVATLVRTQDVKMIFTEQNGSSSAASAIARETGVSTGVLSMLMHDEGRSYTEAMEENLRTVYTGLSGEEPS